MAQRRFSMRRSLASKLRLALLAGLVTGLTAGLASGQSRGRPVAASQPPEAEFHMARLAYESRGCAGSRGWCNPMWAIDYPHAEAHFLPALERMTRIETARDSRHVTLSDDSLFDYPWLFVQQVAQGRWQPSQTEAERLREYLLRGGFVVFDDFHGEDEWRWFQSVIRTVLPGLSIVDIPQDDMLMNIMFSLDKRTQIPGERHLGGWQRMRGPPNWRGIYDDQGRLMVAINHNIDMGDAWEHADDAHYPAPMTATAYRFGVNYVIYAMTH
jgi:hypothetical protein